MKLSRPGVAVHACVVHRDIMNSTTGQSPSPLVGPRNDTAGPIVPFRRSMSVLRVALTPVLTSRFVSQARAHVLRLHFAAANVYPFRFVLTYPVPADVLQNSLHVAWKFDS